MAETRQVAKRRRQRSWLRRTIKRAGESRAAQVAAGNLAAAFISLVGRTSRLVAYEGPIDYHNNWDVHRPLIITMWHGQHFLLPVVRRKDHPVKVLISLHRDGEINAIAAERLGVGTIRGSAARERDRVIESGAVRGFLQMKTALEQGISVCMTADLSQTVAKRAGPGIVSLARATGVPIAPVALASSRRIDLKSWDRASLNLPFSRLAMIVGPFIEVPRDADAAELEAKRKLVEDELNQATERAYAVVDRRG